MLPRLYLQIYLTIVASLILVVVIAGMLWRSAMEMSPMTQAREVVEQLAGGAVAPPGAPIDEQARALRQLSERLGTDLALFGSDLAPIASVGVDLPRPDPSRRGWLHTPRGPAWALNLPDGRWLLLLLPSPPRNPVITLLVFLGAIAFAVALAALPVARRVTRRLERLHDSVEQLGAGDLSARVKVEGKDEVARLAASFNRAAARIEDLVGAHKMLLAHASHELRTPLARIRMGIELLRADADPARKAELERDIAELDELIGEILLASRLDTLEEIGIVEDVDLLALAAEECARYEACALDGEPATVHGDPRLLRRMIRNLLENADRHGRRPIVVEVQPRSSDVVLTVGDDGPAIPATDRERLFAPFFRVPGSSGGTGLGLSLVRQIARRHGGEALYRDAGPRGIFAVTLPMIAGRSI